MTLALLALVGVLLALGLQMASKWPANTHALAEASRILGEARRTVAEAEATIAVLRDDPSAAGELDEWLEEIEGMRERMAELEADWKVLKSKLRAYGVRRIEEPPEYDPAAMRERIERERLLEQAHREVERVLP